MFKENQPVDLIGVGSDIEVYVVTKATSRTVQLSNGVHFMQEEYGGILHCEQFPIKERPYIKPQVII